MTPAVVFFDDVMLDELAEAYSLLRRRRRDQGRPGLSTGSEQLLLHAASWSDVATRGHPPAEEGEDRQSDLSRYTVDEAADRLRTSSRTVRRLIDTKKLRGTYDGRLLFIARTDLEAYEANLPTTF
jgi:excisionase family DNA binding protein